MLSRQNERLSGLVILLSGLWVSYHFWAWSQNQTGIYAYFIAESLGPVFVILGAALIIFPSYRRERIQKGEDIRSLHGLALLTPRWRAVLIVALVVEIPYMYFIGFFNF